MVVVASFGMSEDLCVDLDVAVVVSLKSFDMYLAVFNAMGISAWISAMSVCSTPSRIRSCSGRCPSMIAFTMKGCCISSLADLRSAGSFTRHCESQLLKLSDHKEGSVRVGAGPSMMRYITRIMLDLMCGGSPSTISIAVTPRDHISDKGDTLEPRRTSGAMKMGVPVCSSSSSSCSPSPNEAGALARSRLTPKSASFTSPLSLSNMFAAFKSQ
mmetsp:Transcript_12003/g.33833  ORF Transcript_12003/g.33833 Transcript_12003/m.33833 type:complete len:214 (+) Transcript_12003:234-875(+)